MSLSLQWRLTLWYVGVLLLCLAGAALVASVLRQRLDLRRLDRDLQGSASTVTTAVDAELDEGQTIVDAVKDTDRELSIPGCAFVIENSAGAVLVAHALEVPVAALTAGPQSGLYSVDAGTAQPWPSWRGFASVHTHATTSYRVIVAKSLQPVVHDARVLRDAMWLAIPVAALLATVGGWWIARQGLRPITHLAVQAAGITGSEPGARLDPRGADDELSALTISFNALLGRLEDALQGQRHFMTDASHELRTPVSVVRNAADVVLGRPVRSEAEYRDALSIVSEQSRRLTKLVEDMFLLARADAGVRPLVKTRFYLDELAGECVRGARVLAEARGLTIDATLAADLEIVADEDLVRRLVMNLLDNAVRHTAAGGRVSVALTRDADAGLVLTVRDTGTGVPAPDRERIFERFVRLLPSGQSDGGGLGLPIARWIAEAHGGSLALVETSASGSVFQWRYSYFSGGERR
jgi:heavy metal sensor kinase